LQYPKYLTLKEFRGFRVSWHLATKILLNNKLFLLLTPFELPWYVVRIRVSIASNPTQSTSSPPPPIHLHPCVHPQLAAKKSTLPCSQAVRVDRSTTTTKY